MNNMMKKSIKICSLALVLAGCGVAGTFSVYADAPAAKVEDAASSPVGKALEKADYLTKDRPNTKARYYLFLYSASWCGPCRREMPHVVRTYRKIRSSDDVELVRFPATRRKRPAKAWAKEERMKFPIIKPKKGNGIPVMPRRDDSAPWALWTIRASRDYRTPAKILDDWRKHCKKEGEKK